jgi:hypothetical protein
MDEDPMDFMGQPRRLDSDWFGEKFFEGFFRDPIKFIDKLLIFLAILLGVGVCCAARKRILFLATGDDTIRLSAFDIIRAFTRACAFSGCAGTMYCVYYGWNGKYFFAALTITAIGFTFTCLGTKRFGGSSICCNAGQGMGLIPYIVRIEEICVGNIPVGSPGVMSSIPILSALAPGETADIFVELDLGINPTMSTRVVEGSNGECVYFADTFNVNCHDSALEGDLRIRVMDQDVVGHDELAYVNIEAKQLIAMARDRRMHGAGGVRVPLSFAGSSSSKKRVKPGQTKMATRSSRADPNFGEPWLGMKVSIDDFSEVVRNTQHMKDTVYSTYTQMPKGGFQMSMGGQIDYSSRLRGP